MRKAKSDVLFWADTVRLIDEAWQKKKGRKYPWTGKDFKLLRSLMGWLVAPECLALFSIYLKRSPYWGPRTGWLVSGLFQERGVLIDDPEFKHLTKEFEKKLGMAEVKQVAMELGL